jgi:membrane associated rhomboid family serine protease
MNSFIKASFQSSMVSKLLIINIAVFLFVSVSDVLFYLFGMQGYMEYLAVKFLAMPAALDKLAFRFYTPLTYMFLHTDFWHIFSNMLWLFCIKQILETMLHNRQILGVYILGGLTGAAVYLLSYNVFPVFQPALPASVCLGASAAVTAYIVLIAVLQPDYRVLFFGIFPVTFKWIAVVYVVFDVFQLTGSNAGGHFAHLGGALFGLLFALQLKKGKDITTGFNRVVDNIVSLFSFSGTNHQPKMKVSYRNTKDVREMTDEEFNAAKADDQKRMDEILDKISKSGYDNLTKEEKAFLFKMSRK